MGGSIPTRLAGVDLNRERHVSAFFAGPDDAYAVLLPFIAEGVAQGERAVHIVDPVTREDHLARLAGFGIDVPQALESGQLEVRSWEDTYLRGGRFDKRSMISLIVETLREGRARGFHTTRLIANMEWALLNVPGTSDVATYEASLDMVLRRLPDAVICAYDRDRFGGPLVVDILAAHPLVLMGATLRWTRSARSHAPPRERILMAASELFYREGIRAVGVDTIIAAAGVAKATFYRHFPHKDDLVVDWLRSPESRWFDRVRSAATSRARTPAEAIPLLFEALAEWLDSGGFRGSAFINTVVEIPDSAHPARAVVRDYMLEIDASLRNMLEAAGYLEVDRLVPQLLTLLGGATIRSMAAEHRQPALDARDMAVELLRDARAAPASPDEP
jgi:AcrR family transcriptional regulator